MSKLKILKLLRKKEIISRQSASDVVEKLDAELVEMKRCKAKGLCCGAGGAHVQMFFHVTIMSLLKITFNMSTKFNTIFDANSIGRIN